MTPTRSSFFFKKRDRPQRPKIELEIYRTDNAIKKRIWEVFRKYHYLNTGLLQSAEQWVGVINGELVAHTGIIQFPMRKGWKRVHRLVVLPDYQGIGIGKSFINAVAKHYVEKGWVMNLTTTTPSLIYGLKKDDRWILKRYGREKNNINNWSMYKNKKKYVKASQSSASKNRITYSFYYKMSK